MTAAAARMELAAIGHDLTTAPGGPGERRAAALAATMRRAGARPPLSFTDLARVPAWQRSPRDRQRRLARLAAALAMAPAIAASIDGDWLGGLAETIGDEALDWTIDRADEVRHGLPAIAAAALERRGFDLLRAGLSAPLRALLDWAPAAGETVPPALAATCVRLATARLEEAA